MYYDLAQWSDIGQAAVLRLGSGREPSFYKIGHIFYVLLPIFERQIHELAQLIYHFLNGVILDYQ